MINIIIADHQAIFRAGIAKILAVEDDLRIVGQPKSIEQLFLCLEKLRAKVLVLSSGFTSDLSKLVSFAQGAGVALMVLAESSETASEFTKAGARGVVYRSVPGDSMVEAVRRVARGETFVQLHGTVAGDANQDVVGTRVRDRLSDKEIRIMAAVVRGFKNRDIAGELGIRTGTVKIHLKHIFEKTGIRDRYGLALSSLKDKGLVSQSAAD